MSNQITFRKEMLVDAVSIVDTYTGTNFEDMIDERIASIMHHHYQLSAEEASDVASKAREIYSRLSSSN